MTNQKSTKKAFISSVLSLILCLSMLVGTTFAWFTDSVTSTGNVIKAGNLKVSMEWLEGDEDPTDENAAWIDASTGAIFDYALWEPGYTEVRHIKISNLGSLALKYQVSIASADEVGELAKVIDVYYVDPAEKVTGREFCTDEKFIGTLDQVMAGMATTASGSLEAGESDAITIALKMQESAGNEYQNMSVAGSFEIRLVATQDTVETDSFDDQYDKEAEYPVLPTLLPNATAFNGLIKGEGATANTTNNTVEKVIFGTFEEYATEVAGVTGVDVNGDGSLMCYHVPNGDKEIVYFLSEEKAVLPANSKGMFQSMSAVTEIDTSNLDFSQVENALGMFANCTNLETLDTSEWDTSNITNMQSLFYGCNNLENIDVSEWDTSNVTNMRMVFFRCYELSNDVLKGVENWDVSNVTNFYSMFKHARGLTSLDLSNWDTSSATTMSHMFANIGGVQTLDLSGFDTSNVTDMSWMFYDASQLTTIYVGDGWTTAAVSPDTSKPFYNNQALVGGAGTVWTDVCDMANPNRPWESSAKLDYAIVDGGADNPGLLTHK